MEERRTWWAVAMAAAVLVSGAAPVAAAAPNPPAAAGAAGVRTERRASLRSRLVESRRRPRWPAARPLSPATTSAPSDAAQVAVEGDVLTIPDPPGDAVNGPKGDIRSVSVGSRGDGLLSFTMQVEQYSNPTSDTTWTVGFSGAYWFLDTSGDGVPDLIVEMYNDRSGIAADVFDVASLVTVCAAVASTNAVDKTYTAIVTDPGCLGDVRRPAVGGVFYYDLDIGPVPSDAAPDGGSLVLFDQVIATHAAPFERPPTGRPAGGYTIVSRGAGYQRFGALPPGPVDQGGTLADFPGDRPGVGTATGRDFWDQLWAVTDDGAVLTEGFADWWGDPWDTPLAQPIVGMAIMPDASGYWLVAADGGVFAYGGAGFFGSTGAFKLNKPIVGMAATPSGLGYWLVASDGGIFAFGDAVYHGSTGALRLNKPVVGMAAGLQGQGYWLVASDGGIFAFGLPYHGSTGNLVLQQPIVGMSATRSGGGYRFLARDGGVFSFGDAEFHGSGAAPGRTDVVGLASA